MHKDPEIELQKLSQISVEECSKANSIWKLNSHPKDLQPSNTSCFDIDTQNVTEKNEAYNQRIDGYSVYESNELRLDLLKQGIECMDIELEYIQAFKDNRLYHHLLEKGQTIQESHANSNSSLEDNNDHSSNLNFDGRSRF